MLDHEQLLDDQGYSREKELKRALFEMTFTLKCPNCGTDEHLIENTQEGTMVCTECGAVVSDKLVDLDQEWREFADDEDKENKSRVGGPANPLLAYDLSTSISSATGAGKAIIRSQMRGSKQETDKYLKEGFRTIEDLGNKIELQSRNKSTAQELYKNMYDIKAVKSSKDILGYAAAALYAACKIGGVPRQIKEFMALSGLLKKDIGKYYKKIELQSKKMISKSTTGHDDTLNVGYDVSTPAQMIPRFVTSLKLPYRVQAAAEHVARKAVELGVTAGKSPTTVAAACIYMCSQMAGQDKREMKEITLVTGVGEATIRKTLRDLEQNRSRLLPANFQQH